MERKEELIASKYAYKCILEFELELLKEAIRSNPLSFWHKCTELSELLRGVRLDSNNDIIPYPKDKCIILFGGRYFISIHYAKNSPKGISITIPVAMNPRAFAFTLKYHAIHFAAWIRNVIKRLSN
jgi:hypothetical protein